MKVNRFTHVGIALMIVLLAGNLLVMLARPSHAATAGQFKVVKISSGGEDAAVVQRIEQTLNQQAQEGWLLVAFGEVNLIAILRK